MPDEQLSHPEIVDTTAEAEVVPVPVSANDPIDLSESDITPAMIDAVRTYYELQRFVLQQRIADMEKMLGFIEVEGDLAARVAKLERFTGIG